MSEHAFTFAYNIPFTEEDMVDVAREVIRLNPSRENYLNTIEVLRQTADVMQEYLNHIDKKMKAK